jgi:hypothetical protein
MNHARRYQGAALLAAALFAAGCQDSHAAGAEGPADASPPPDAGTASTSASPPPIAPAPQPTAAPRAPLELLKMTLTSAVKKKEPVDKLDAATPGQRVWVHLTLRNRSGAARRVHVEFSVNGKLRTPLDLDVDPSWSFRTWGYNTLQASDAGELAVRVTDDTGAEIGAARLPITMGGRKAP